MQVYTATSADQFTKMSLGSAKVLNTMYDYSSIMHYGAYAFTKNGLQTVAPVEEFDENSRKNVIGQQRRLSATDVLRINRLYSCPQEMSEEFLRLHPKPLVDRANLMLKNAARDPVRSRGDVIVDDSAPTRRNPTTTSPPATPEQRHTSPSRLRVVVAQPFVNSCANQIANCAQLIADLGHVDVCTGKCGQFCRQACGACQ